MRLLSAAIISSALLLRIIVGFHPHSGQDDYQGPLKSLPTTHPPHRQQLSKPTKYGGDYEAQRHWMEITYHLPISEWYYHDLSYWGLDYPPLTAYVSYFFGWVAHSVGGMTPQNSDDDVSSHEIDEGDFQKNEAQRHKLSFDVCDEKHSEVCIEKMVNSGSGRRNARKGLGVLRDLVALHSSRWGFEHSGGKLYMRFTVLLCDLLIYMSAVWVLAKRLVASEVEWRNVSSSTSKEHDPTQSPTCTSQEHEASLHVWLLLTALFQPAIILIDHGHFQYNSVSLGLALWSFHHITTNSTKIKADDRHSSSSSSFMGPIWGSVLFSLALNFKQMELYHSPAVFAYLLGRCFRHDNGTVDMKQNNSSMWTVGRRFTALGMAVILTFSLLWLPFAMGSQSDNTAAVSLDGVRQIVIRLFPFHRGLFEGKVANLWCALSVKPFSIRDRVPSTLMPLAALGLTLALILPPCCLLFRVGCGDMFDRDVDSSVNCDSPPIRLSRLRKLEGRGNDDLRLLLWGVASTSLAFFLASYQVHEKGILISVAPISLLVVEAPNFVLFFSILATWSLWPLLVIDRLGDAYVCCLTIFACIYSMTRVPSSELSSYGDESDIFSDKHVTRYVLTLAVSALIILHILEATILPPRGLPDLYPVIWSLAGCGMFCLSYLGTLIAIVKQCNRDRRCELNQKTRRKAGSIPPISIVGFLLLTCATSEGFLLRSSLRNINAPIICADSFLSSGNDGTGDIITEDLLCRARIRLEWERKIAHENLPVLNLSIRESDITSSVSVAESTDELGDQDDDDWIHGTRWKLTEQHLVDMGIISYTETNKRSDLTSHQMYTRAPQLFRLPTSQILDAARFLLLYPSGKKSVNLIKADPSLLTYRVDDLHYGLCEYLPNMMFMGNNTIAAETIESQLSRNPSFALQLIRLAVDGGIDERVSTSSFEILAIMRRLT